MLFFEIPRSISRHSFKHRVGILTDKDIVKKYIMKVINVLKSIADRCGFGEDSRNFSKYTTYQWYLTKKDKTTYIFLFFE